MTDSTDRRAEFATGLRAVADWFEVHPEIAIPYAHQIGIYDLGEDEAVGLAAVARAMGSARKDATEDFISLFKDFGGNVSVKAWAYRNAVCERVVVGTETVTKLIPDPTAPEVEVIEEVEIVEWRCAPILAAEIGE